MARSAGFKMPELSPRAKDADELGALREQMDSLLKQAKKIELRLKKCVGKTFHGHFFDAKIWASSTRTLSKAKLRKHLTEKQLEACYEPGEDRITVKTTRHHGDVL